jgi:nucleoside-diphosphate-sugar epimerase
MNGSTVTVFGGTGFLGRRVVRHLRERRFYVRIASRHPDHGRMLGIDDPQLQSIRADIHDARSPMRLLALMVWSMRLVFMSSALCEELVWDGDPKRTSGSVLAVATIAY